jgi:nitrogen regulatory protein PII-like uncharacterized protein
MTYKEAIQIFNELNPNGGSVTVSTLGVISTFHVQNHSETSLKVINSSNNTYVINEIIWNKVAERMNELPPEEKLYSKRYTLGKGSGYWKDCPNKVLAVYIPAIIRDFKKYKKN